MLELKDVSKFYYKKGMITTGFTKVNLKFDMGEFIAITGESGSGKSTLLNVISGLDSYDEGELYINGEETSYYTEKDYEIYRRKYIGNIFQNFNLVNSYTVYQNIELVYLLNGYKASEVKDDINDLIKKVDLVKFKNRKVSRLSGGQKQRVAIARALAQNTPIILADEPTGNLDKKSSENVLKLLHDISKDKLVIVVTHNYEQIEEYVTRKITMSDGRIIEDKKIKAHDVVEKVEETNFDFMTTSSKIKIGIRNAFNILSKFLIITFVYFFVVSSIFISYGAFLDTKAISEEGNYNQFFDTSDKTRIVINKKDKSIITEEDYKKLESIDNVKSITKNDYMIDYYMSLNTDEYWFSGKVRRASTLDKVSFGRLPENDNEFVISGYPLFEPLLDETRQETTFADNYNISELFDIKTEKYEQGKIVGVILQEDDYEYRIYATDNMIERIYNEAFKMSQVDIEYTFLGNSNTSYINSVYGEILPSDKVKKGQALVSEDYAYSCKNFNCKNYKINIKSKNIYSTIDKTVKVSKMYNKKNFNKLTGYKYDKFNGAIFINTEDYKALFDKNNYQSSVFLADEDEEKTQDTLQELDALGYKTLYLKDTLKLGDNNTIVRILNIVRVVFIIILIVVLFFISYFVIKLVLKSRNIYYSTLRILGSTKKDTKTLLNIELFTFVNIAYAIFMIIIVLNITGKINLEPVTIALKYNGVETFVFVYAVVAFMSLLTTNRYSRKLFVDSVMNTYREEV